MRLLPRQARFVCEYVKSKNGEEAAVKAGYKTLCARNHAARLLKNEYILKAIADKQHAIAMRALLSVEDVVRETMIVAFSSLGDYLDFSGDEIVDKAARDIDEMKLRALQSVKITTKTLTLGRGDDALTETTKTVEYKLWDKMVAIEKLAKHFGMFLDQDQMQAIMEKQAEIEARMKSRANGESRTSNN